MNGDRVYYGLLEGGVPVKWSDSNVEEEIERFTGVKGSDLVQSASALGIFLGEGKEIGMKYTFYRKEEGGYRKLELYIYPERFVGSDESARDIAILRVSDDYVTPGYFGSELGDEKLKEAIESVVNPWNFDILTVEIFDLDKKGAKKKGNYKVRAYRVEKAGEGYRITHKEEERVYSGIARDYLLPDKEVLEELDDGELILFY